MSLLRRKGAGEELPPEKKPAAPERSGKEPDVRLVESASEAASRRASGGAAGIEKKRSADSTAADEWLKAHAGGIFKVGGKPAEGGGDLLKEVGAVRVREGVGWKRGESPTLSAREDEVLGKAVAAGEKAVGGRPVVAKSGARELESPSDAGSAAPAAPRTRQELLKSLGTTH